ncbi:hypothetical protein HDU90_009060 [Geranomyces variabilis]|nr:hypothetical protein HDU90_009060 [Geranomyces variabilis]
MHRVEHPRVRRTRNYVDADIDAIIEQFGKPAPRDEALPPAKRRKPWPPLKGGKSSASDSTLYDEESSALYSSIEAAKNRKPRPGMKFYKEPRMESTLHDEDLNALNCSTEDEEDHPKSESESNSDDDSDAAIHRRASSDDSIVVSDSPPAPSSSSDSVSSARPDEVQTRMIRCNCPHCPYGNKHYVDASPVASDSSNESLIQASNSSNEEMEGPARTPRRAAKEAKMNLKDCQRII